MKVGSIVFSTNSGLGILAKDFYDNGIITDDDDISDNSAPAKPVKTQIQQRKPTLPEPTTDTSNSAAQANNSRSNDSVPQNPLSVTPVQRMPPMPE